MIENSTNYLFKANHCSIADAHYQIISHFYEHERYLYRNFIISQQGAPYMLYELGITYDAAYQLNICSPHYVSSFLLPLGLNFVYDQLQTTPSNHRSSLITAQALTEQPLHWRTLPTFEEVCIH
ncbi:hypothetical protein A374_04644 [Fictibacillus macauensis ZFHKF-1]|uniref:Uncharacterized protein n=1 Tax=Fictibacillus macauensis ZFHKF-1 TaxID=1196324 RepID=I8UJ25_9BACL|nr:hypothetical protein [Fictibacillus macauensis]EIT86833.1 hypothetical protein A374_04644 [Fictibacillus macauensis ZFHKF-1]